MNRKRIYIFSLVGFFLMWASFGLIAAIPRGEAFLQATPPAVEPTLVAPVTQPAGIPVTGEAEPVWTEIMVFYGLIGLTALFLILALLNLVNKSTAQRVEGKASLSDKTQNQ